MTPKSEPAMRKFLDTARVQFKRGCIPAAAAVLVSRLLAWIEAPLVPLLLLGVAAVAYFRGYRINVSKREQRKEKR